MDICIISNSFLEALLKDLGMNIPVTGLLHGGLSAR